MRKLVQITLLIIVISLYLQGCSEIQINRDVVQHTELSQNHDEYANLKAIKEQIVDSIGTENINDRDINKEEKSFLNSIKTIYVDETENKVIVGIKDISDKKINKFREDILDSDYIKFIDFSDIVVSDDN